MTQFMLLQAILLPESGRGAPAACSSAPYASPSRAGLTVHTAFWRMQMPFCVSLVTVFQPHLLGTHCIPSWGQELWFCFHYGISGSDGAPRGWPRWTVKRNLLHQLHFPWRLESVQPKTYVLGAFQGIPGDGHAARPGEAKMCKTQPLTFRVWYLK